MDNLFLVDPGEQEKGPSKRVERCSETIDLFGDSIPYQSHSLPSLEAALGIAGNAGTLRRLVYDRLIEHGPATDREMQHHLGMAGSTQRPRRVRLVELGLVRDSGKKRRHEGRASTVWEVVK